MNTKSSHRLGALCASLLLGATFLAGCGDSDSDSDAPAASGQGDQTCIDAADAYMAEVDELPTNLPEEYTPLQNPVEEGKFVAFVGAGAQPADADTFDGIKEAADAIGWTSEFYSHSGAIEDQAAKFDQAISDGADVIVLQGTPPSALQAQVDAAKAAGIEVHVSAVTEMPVDNVGYSSTTNGPDGFEMNAELLANWVAKDSGCTAHAAYYGLPFEILKINGDAFVAGLEDLCSECKATYSEIQAKDIGTPAATQAMVSAVQSDPSIKYIGVNVGVLVSGLPEAFAQAGIEGVKIFGISPDANNIKSLQEGSSSLWIGKTSVTAGWTAMDAVLREMDTDQPFTGYTPIQSIMTTENIDPDATGVVNYPEDFRTQYETLWGVG